MPFDQVVSRRGTDSNKWNRYGDDVLPMWVADMDFSAPPHVLEVLHSRVAHGVYGYSSPTARLDELVMRRIAERYGWQVDPDWLLWMPGIVPGLNVACHAIGDRARPVATCVPVYYPFRRAPGNAGRAITEIPMACDSSAGLDRWVFDFDALDAGLADSDLFMLCNPFNPVGRILERDELLAVAECCARHDVTLVSDEIHLDLLLDERPHLPVAGLDPDIARRSITMMAWSKTYNLAGLGGCGVAIIPDETLRRQFRRWLGNGLVSHVNTMAATALEAALEDDGVWLEALLEHLRGNRALVEARIGALEGVRLAHVEATYLAWIDVRALGLGGNAHDHFVAHGLGLSDGVQFGGEGWLRLNFGCPQATLEEGLGRFESAVAALRR